MTIAFNEAVRGFAADDIDFTGTASATAALAGIGKVYTATVASSLEGTLGIQVPAGVAYDAANNGNTISTRHTVQIDAVAPTVTIDVPTTVQGRDFAVTVTFSESVTGFVQSELFLSGAGVTVAAFNGSGTDYEATITPVESGTVTLNIAANVAEDALGNPNSAATEQTVRVDMTGPTATIEVPSEPQGGAFVVRVTFSEAVTGYVESELTVSGAGASVIAFNGSGTNYEATITPVESGTVTLNVAADVVQDTLGNPNSAATEQTVQVEMTGPTVTSEVPSETTLLQNYPNPFSVEA